MIGTLQMSGSEPTSLKKLHHRCLRVQHRFVHVDINDLRAIVDLAARDR
jgi:hypothetical protein